jgi:hypothetical protein
VQIPKPKMAPVGGRDKVDAEILPWAGEVVQKIVEA